MKVSEQTKVVIGGLDNSAHSFFSKLAQALQDRIEADTGMKVAFVGKMTSGKGTMKAVLTGELHDIDPKKIEDAQKRLERLMSEIRNPSNLIELIK